MFIPKAVLLVPPLFLAEATYDGVKSSVLGEFLVTACAGIAMGLLIWTAIEKFRGVPQKREVSFSDEYASKEEHDALKAEVLKIDNERRVSVAKLHEKTDEIAKTTSETKGQLSTINQQLQQINIHLINRASR